MPSADEVAQEVADELYALTPASFTSARDAAVARARDEGDRERARRLAALKRPTQGAHLVNLLALRRPELVADLVALGARIREAQGTVPAAQVRELSTQRRALIGAALRECRALAMQAGSGEPTAAQLAEAEATLAAAMADDQAAATVRAGRVVKALHYVGFGGGFGTAGPVRRPTQKAQAVRPATQPSTVEAQAAAEAAPEVDRAAWERLSRAESGLAAARSQEQAANEEMDRIADEITRLRGALENAARRARSARTAREAAEREAAAARRAVDGGP